MAHGIVSWSPVTLATFGPTLLACLWSPVTSGPRCHRASASWSPVTGSAPGPETPCMIVLARAEDFGTDSDGNQVWLPLARGQFGTVAATRTLGWGTVLSTDRGKTAPRETTTDDSGLLLAGTVGDQTETISVHCDVAMMDPDDEPETGDFMTLEGRTFCIFDVQLHSEHDADREMTVSGVLWKGCTTVSTPAGITAPMAWTS